MPPYFLYRVMPDPWAEWIIDNPERLSIALSVLSLALAIAALTL